MTVRRVELTSPAFGKFQEFTLRWRDGSDGETDRCLRVWVPVDENARMEDGDLSSALEQLLLLFDGRYRVSVDLDEDNDALLRQIESFRARKKLREWGFG